MTGPGRRWSTPATSETSTPSTRSGCTGRASSDGLRWSRFSTISAPCGSGTTTGRSVRSWPSSSTTSPVSSTRRRGSRTRDGTAWPRGCPVRNGAPDGSSARRCTKGPTTCSTSPPSCDGPRCDVVRAEYACLDGSPFPVTFADPSDLALRWVIDREHAPVAMTPLADAVRRLGRPGAELAYGESGLRLPSTLAREPPVANGYDYDVDDWLPEAELDEFERG